MITGLGILRFGARARGAAFTAWVAAIGCVMVIMVIMVILVIHIPVKFFFIYLIILVI